MPKSIRCQRLSTEDVEIAIICPDFEIGIRRPVPLIEHVFDQVFVAVETESGPAVRHLCAPNSNPPLISCQQLTPRTAEPPRCPRVKKMTARTTVYQTRILDLIANELSRDLKSIPN